METDLPVAPSVVSVMVVHEPGEWFDATLAAIVGAILILFVYRLVARR